MPRVSVVIPTYNRASFVREAIDSVLAQTFTDFELIVIDDGSTDDTPAVLAPYGNRIRYIRQENRGEGMARNAGLAVATGEWVSFLDSDDLMLPDNLSALVALVDARPEIDVAYGWYFFMDENGVPSPSRGGYRRWEADQVTFPPGIVMHPSGPLMNGDILADLLLEESMLVGTSLIRRDRVVAIGGFRPLRHQAHWDFYLRLAEAGCLFACCNRGVMFFRLHDGNVGMQFDKMLSSRLAILDRFFGNAALAQRLTRVRARAYYNAYIDTAIMHYKSGGFEQGAECLTKALACSPLRPQDASVLVHTLAAHALAAGPGREVEAARELIGLLPSAGDADGLGRKTLGRINSELASRHFKRGEVAAWRYAWQAFRADPSQLYQPLTDPLRMRAYALARRIRRSLFARDFASAATDQAE
jgi:glycosyltransferase involved in cell wall biosynthesis